MKIIFFVTLALATASAFTISEKPAFIEDLVNDDIQGLEGRITNGIKASPGQFPYQVGLSLKRSTGSYWCGGSLIGNNWVLTAAHCTEGVYSVIVYLGSTTRRVAKVTHTVSSSAIYQHADYKASTIANDISLIKIPTVSYTAEIRAIKLPPLSSSYSSYAGNNAIASGWGRTSDGSTVTSQLNYANLPIITNSECSKYFAAAYVTANTICTGTPSGTSTCNGDSGGPLVLGNGNVLVGVSSFVSGAGCQSESPAGFVRVTSYLGWIKERTGISY